MWTRNSVTENHNGNRYQGRQTWVWSVRRCEIVEALGLLFLIVGLFLLGFTPLDLETSPWLCLLSVSVGCLALGAWLARTAWRHDPRPPGWRKILAAKQISYVPAGHDPRPPGWRKAVRKARDPMMNRSWHQPKQRFGMETLAGSLLIGSGLLIFLSLMHETGFEPISILFGLIISTAGLMVVVRGARRDREAMQGSPLRRKPAESWDSAVMLEWETSGMGHKSP